MLVSLFRSQIVHHFALAAINYLKRDATVATEFGHRNCRKATASTCASESPPSTFLDKKRELLTY